MSLEQELAAKFAGPLKALHIVTRDDSFLVAFMVTVDTTLDTHKETVGCYVDGTGTYITRRGELIELPMSLDTWKEKVCFHWDR